MVPSGWTDVVVNGDPQLHNPKNSFIVRGGFRQHILNAASWGGWNIPVENEHTDPVIAQSNPAFGGGVSQLFEDSWLVMPAPSNQIGEGWMGDELLWHKNQHASDQSALTAANAQIADLQAKLAACNQPPPPIVQVPDDLQSAINTVASLIPVVQKYAK